MGSRESETKSGRVIFRDLNLILPPGRSNVGVHVLSNSSACCFIETETEAIYELFFPQIFLHQI